MGPGSSSVAASSGASGGTELGTLCDDGIDNDQDGFTDCEDFDCEGPFCGACVDDSFCSEDDDACTCSDCFGDQQCSACDGDGICDFFTEDCGCFDCLFHPICAAVGPASTSVGPGPSSSASTGGFGSETSTECADDLDNDFDFLVDCADPDCDDGPFCGACNPNGFCSAVDDACTCDDCALDSECGACDFDGECDYFYEPCDCADCADDPVCD